jgi:hypothetical protein
MEPLDNLATLHVEEERLRGVHLEQIANDEPLRDHIYLIREAMNILWALAHDHTNRSDDELVLPTGIFGPERFSRDVLPRRLSGEFPGQDTRVENG